MKDLYIVGAGGFGREVLFTAKRINSIKRKWINFYFVDDTVELGSVVSGVKVVGKTEYLSKVQHEIDVVVSIAKNAIRKDIINRIDNEKVHYPNIIDPSCIFSDDAICGYGNIIMLNTVVSVDVVIGGFNILNSYTSVGHDTEIGNYNTFYSRNVISGDVVIGNFNTFGLMSAVVQNIKIGNNNNVWINTTMIKNIKDNGAYYGNPPKKIGNNN